MIKINDKIRIVRLDKYCLELQEYRLVVNNKTKEEREDWVRVGYYGDLKSAIGGVLKQGKYWRNKTGVKQILLAPKQEHSKKPTEIRDRIIELCGDLPRIELFARQYSEGWDCWGNEV